MGNFIALVALTALTVVEHDGVKYGPGQEAGTDFKTTDAQAAALLSVNAAKLASPSETTAGPTAGQLSAAAEFVGASRLAAEDAQAKADRDAQAAADAQAQADRDAQAVADARAKLDADIKAFEDAKAAAAKAKK